MMFAHSTLISTYLPLEGSVRDQLSALGIIVPSELEGATLKRKEEFLAGRYCAMTALMKAGCKMPAQVGYNEDRSPLWPTGWVGSITHARGLAAAVAAPRELVLGLGIDIEPVMSEARAQKVKMRILTGNELDHGDDPAWVTLVFSAKESIYKCLRPLCGKFFGFEDAELFEISADGNFRFRLKADIGGDFRKGWEGAGKYEKRNGTIHTAMELLISRT